MRSIWEKIKLTLGRKPRADILLPAVPSGVTITVTPPQKPKRTRKPKNEST
jgi:hypothetical protein